MSGAQDMTSGIGTTLPFNTENAREKEYCVYTAMQNISGHRMAYLNNNTEPGSFYDYDGTATTGDYLGFVI